MTYVVKYRLKGYWFFRNIRSVSSDCVLGTPQYPIAARVFDTSDGQRFEVPMDGTVFAFGKERAELIARKMAKEIEQKSRQ